MNVIQSYLDKNNITRYQVYKASGLSQMTLKHATESKKGIDGVSGKVLKAIAVTLGKTPGQVLDELIALEGLSIRQGDYL